MAVKSVAQNLGAVDSEGVGPVLNRGRVIVRDTKAEHRHTRKHIVYDDVASGLLRKRLVVRRMDVWRPRDRGVTLDFRAVLRWSL
jgi:hypothetical protein